MGGLPKRETSSTYKFQSVPRRKSIVSAFVDPSFQTGVFYGSDEKKVTGALVDQGEIFADLKDTTFQSNAAAALHRFL